ncbi:MAG: DUF502 domain-containing protein [Marinicaulis sp.]|nr:DUF502 domain-containing protein [Marinicaulis sp.]
MNNEDTKKSRDEAALIKPKRKSIMSGLWSSFLAGIVVVAPISITIAVVLWVLTGPVARLDAFVKRTLPDGGSFIETLLQVFPFGGVIIAFIVIVLLGALAKNIVGRSFMNAGERVLERVPVIRNLYGFFKNVFETALRQSDRSFKEVALIEYPRKGAWVMAFVVGSAKGEVKELLNDQGEGLTALFVPTVPNPTSGFLLFLPRDQLRILDMHVEDAAKLIFSMGLVVPEYTNGEDAVKKLEEIAEVAKKESAEKKRFFSIGSK